MKRIAVVGGGAAGYFAAIHAAEAAPAARVSLFEQSRRPLAKVAISGGGRCNVTHSCFEPAELARYYPRGAKELRGAFHRWQPQDTINWFAERGVALKTESDGRMFPTTDDSATIVQCLLEAARRSGVESHIGCGISDITIHPSGFECKLSDGSSHVAENVILATGGGQSASGHRIAAALGHRIAPLAPSLFSFHIEHPLLDGLAGLSLPQVSASYPPAKLRQSGPILITHNGLSGPAVLRLSAWGARIFKEQDYRFETHLNWIGGGTRPEAREALESARRQFAKRQLSSANPFDFPKRLWERMLEINGLAPTGQWAQIPNKGIADLVELIVESKLPVTGKSMNKEEFVTCGGVALEEVDFRDMQSRLVPGLRFAGEALDIDGVTGGFNFQAAWTTGHLAGKGAALAP